MTKESAVDLKACPFCGSKAETCYMNRTGKYWITCSNEKCKAVVATLANTEGEAIKQWNTRNI